MKRSASSHLTSDVGWKLHKTMTRHRKEHREDGTVCAVLKGKCARTSISIKELETDAKEGGQCF